MSNFIYTVDLRGVGSDKELFQRFYDSFQVPSSGYNWHALHDRMHNLDSDSEVCKHDGVSSGDNVHVILKNIDDVRRYSEDSYSAISKVLVGLTEKRQRYDGLAFTFEIDNEDRDEVGRG